MTGRQRVLLAGLAILPPLLMSAALVLWGGPAAPLAGLPIVAPAAFVGALLIVRYARNPIGWVLYVQATGMGFEEAAVGWAAAGLPGAVWPVWVASWAWAPALVGVLVLLPLTFPDGHLPSQRWRPVVWLAAAGVAGFVVGNAFYPQPVPTGEPNPAAWPGAAGVLDALRLAGAVLVAVSVGLAVTAAVRRFRASRGVERTRLKWFAFGAVLAGVGLITMGVLYESGYSTAAKVVMGTASAALPVAIALAIFRYRLYEIDKIVSRTVTYAVVAGLLAAVFASMSIGLPRVIGLPEDNTLLVAASTLAVAALFNPLRHRVQAVVDRRFNRSRYDAQQTVDAFAARLRDEVGLDQLSSELLGVVGRTMEPAAASLWLRLPGEQG